MSGPRDARCEELSLSDKTRSIDSTDLQFSIDSEAVGVSSFEREERKVLSVVRLARSGSEGYNARQLRHKVMRNSRRFGGIRLNSILFDSIRQYLHRGSKISRCK